MPRLFSDIRDMSGRALMLARSCNQKIRLTKVRVPTAASNTRERKGEKRTLVLEIHWDSFSSSSHKHWSKVAVVKGTLGSQKYDAFFHFDDDDIITSR